MNSRRRFLQYAGVVSAAPFIPGFLQHSLANDPNADNNGKILVVVQLNGGNDGLNTVIPFAQGEYLKRRPEIGIRRDNVLKINDEVGLNPSMQAAADLLEEGRFSIVQNVGYPNPDRSHFRSMAIWQTASNADDLPANGWVGRALDAHVSGGTDSLFVGDEDLPLSLRGRRSVATSMSPGKTLKLNAKIDPRTVMATPEAGEGLQNFVHRNVLHAYTTVQELNRPRKRTSAAVYPNSDISRRLQTISQFIGMDTKARIYCAIQSGYDTHDRQLGSHNNLLSEFSNAVKAFLDDMKAMGLADRVVLMAFSEFGRRVSENGSAGTDHGTAGPVFLAGQRVKDGLIGDAPNLSDLDGDDLKMQFDFRQVYASLLEDWLQIPSAPALGGTFDRIPMFV